MDHWTILNWHLATAWSWGLAITRFLYLVLPSVFRLVVPFLMLCYMWHFQFANEKYGFNHSLYSNWYQNVGVHYEKWNVGVLGPVTLKGLNEGTRDLSKQKWSYKVCYHLYIGVLRKHFNINHVHYWAYLCIYYHI